AREGWGVATSCTGKRVCLHYKSFRIFSAPGPLSPPRLALARHRGRFLAVQQILLDERAIALGHAGLVLEALDGLRVAALPRGGGELAGQHHLLLERADGGPQGRLQGLRLLPEQGLPEVSVADVAVEAEQVLLVHLAH